MRLIILALLLSFPAHAHQAISGWSYDGACCSDRDCVQIEAKTVKATRDGWLVTVTPADHPFLTKTRSKLFAYPEEPQDGVKTALPSGDEKFHVCIGPRETFFCLYVPPVGS